MGLFFYERPREKMQTEGVEGLSTVELLQILIGSGTVGASSARIAQRLHTMLAASAHTVPSVSQLKNVPGIGVAKACTVIAALELGRRLEVGARRS